MSLTGQRPYGNLLPEEWKQVGRVHLCVTCVSGKKVCGGPRFRHFRQDSLGQAFVDWRQRIERDVGADNRLHVNALYKGQLWQLFLNAFAMLPPESRVLWVISAGLGLVGSDDRAPKLGYSATFSPPTPQRESPDFVGDPVRWWNLLSNWNTQFFNHARSIHDLYSELQCGDVLIVVCSTSYFDALRDDLARIQPDRDHLLILAGTATAIGRLPPQLKSRAFTFTVRSAEIAPGEIAVEVVRRLLLEMQRKVMHGE